MKRIQCTFVFMIMIAIGGSPLHAQSIDQKRMDRDINISETILQEIFKTRWETDRSGVNVFSSGNDNNITGTYLDNYGVIFTIIGGPPVVGLISNGNGNVPNYEFQNTNNNTKEVTKESIINRIQEFLQSYGSTIGQLSNNDRITIIYKNNPYERLGFVTLFSPDKRNNSSDKKATYNITVTVKETDLQAFRKSSINENQFNNRLTISAIDKPGNERKLSLIHI